jgi:hypothetical protein
MSSGTAVLCEPTFDANKSERTFDANKSGTGYISKRVAIKDCSFLLGIVLLSCLSYVGRLGFYSDDWDTWALFYGAKDQSLVSLMRATIARPTSISGFIRCCTT